MKSIKRSTLAIALLALVIVIAAAVWLTRKPASEPGAPVAAAKDKAGVSLKEAELLP